MQEEQNVNNEELRQFGFQSAINSQSMPESIFGYLNKVYDKFLETQKLDEQSIKNRIFKLKEEIVFEKNKKNELQAETTTHLANKKDKEEDIKDLELEKVAIKNGEGEVGDNASFIIGAFITLFLTLYLFVFYSSSGYSVFYGIKQKSLGFLNSNVFADALGKGPGVFAVIILFPIIFLGLGFLIHNALEENKKLEKEGKSKKITVIASLIFITLIADAFIGYKISEGVHNNNFSEGKTNELWHFSMVFSDINFYLVLILGFVVYVIWGFLLNYVLSHPYLKTESEKTKYLIELINEKLVENRNGLNAIIAKIAKAESDCLSCDTRIQQKEKDILGYITGDVPVNVSALKGNISEFMGGWQYCTYGNFTSEQALQLNNEAIIAQENWLEQKMNQINSEN